MTISASGEFRLGGWAPKGVDWGSYLDWRRERVLTRTLELGGSGLWDPTLVGEENKTFFIRVWKPLPCLHVLKTLEKKYKENHICWRSCLVLEKHVLNYFLVCYGICRLTSAQCSRKLFNMWSFYSFKSRSFTNKTKSRKFWFLVLYWHLHYKWLLQLLSSDDLWMYAPIAYNGMDIGLNPTPNTPKVLWTNKEDGEVFIFVGINVFYFIFTYDNKTFRSILFFKFVMNNGSMSLTERARFDSKTSRLNCT